MIHSEPPVDPVLRVVVDVDYSLQLADTLWSLGMRYSAAKVLLWRSSEPLLELADDVEVRANSGLYRSREDEVREAARRIRLVAESCR